MVFEMRLLRLGIYTAQVDHVGHVERPLAAVQRSAGQQSAVELSPFGHGPDVLTGIRIDPGDANSAFSHPRQMIYDDYHLILYNDVFNTETRRAMGFELW